MVCRDLFNPNLLRKKVHEILSRVQGRSFKTKPDFETLKILRGIGLLFLSILLSWVSFNLTESQSVKAFLNSQWPKEKIWTQTLSSHGFVKRGQLGEYTELLESHPNAYSNESKIWISQDACVIYLSKSPYRSGAELWTCELDPKSRSWANLGSGLRGFEKLLDFFENSPKKSVREHSKTPKRIDPKEFHY
jgi:hypothetical protein